MNTKGNEPAFARPATGKDETFVQEQVGLTKREYFAGLAMQGLLANPELTKTDDAVIAMTCIDAANALIEALNKTAQ